MDRAIFRPEDRTRFAEVGISEEEALRQIRLLENPPGFARLDRPCTAGDGIRVLSGAEIDASLAAYERARAERRFLKFVPASGAASRMFRALLRFLGDDHDYPRREIVERARDARSPFAELRRFLEGIDRFAFSEPLCRAAGEEGEGIAALAASYRYRPILEALLSPAGLDYGRLPKGLIPFHRYGAERRTPFEDHLAEAGLYALGAEGPCRLHFTVSSMHEEAFRRLLAEVRPRWEERYATTFNVGFSTQKRSTDTLAVDEENRIFRDDAGRILLRPGGHGALIENLNDSGGDIVFIKNIDNVSPRQLEPDLIAWKKTLAGFLVRTQEKIFRWLVLLEKGAPDAKSVDESIRFARGLLSIGLPDGAGRWGDAERREFVLGRLARPLRVCGMVPGAGHAGGGPFWVKGKDGSDSLQIVETAQVDPASREQGEILRASTHFNPVALVCALRDRRGEPFDLGRYVDRDAVFLSDKSRGGRRLKALERPGLWNGAMADWNTIFVEVPPETFTPVKQVTDLLKEEHRATGG